MAFSMAGGGPSGSQMNVTPLIDVTASAWSALRL